MIGQCQVVNQFIYLCALITNRWGCAPEIRCRAEIARRTMKSIEKTWRGKTIALLGP